MIQTIIFDFDGVIHDTFNFHLHNLNKFISGEKISPKELRAVHEGNFFDNKNVIEKIEKIDFGKYRTSIYDEYIQLKIKQNIKDTLVTLAKDHSLYIITSGGENNIKGYLKENSMAHVFIQSLGGETHTSKVVKLQMVLETSGSTKEEMIFVTDTLGDIKEGNEFGIQTIAVDFGYHTKTTLEKGNPLTIISHFDELLDVVAKISSQ